MSSLAVRVPATSANLGPGFDALGAAVRIYLTVRVVEREERRVVTEGEGADELATDDSNLVWRALAAWHDRTGTALPDISLHVRNDIPLERGLGSSAAAAVAGAVLGRALTGAGADADVIALAAELEGHADNAAAAVLGGLVVCYDQQAQRLEPAPHLRPVVCVPEARQATSAARGLLPDSIPLAAAAANGARAATVLAGLCGAASWDPAAMHDVLHEPARFDAMPGSGRLAVALRAAGVGAALSGAGPAVLAITTEDEQVERVRAVAGAGWQVIVSSWDLGGATVTADSAMLG